MELHEAIDMIGEAIDSQFQRGPLVGNLPFEFTQFKLEHTLAPIGLLEALIHLLKASINSAKAGPYQSLDCIETIGHLRRLLLSDLLSHYDQPDKYEVHAESEARLDSTRTSHKSTNTSAFTLLGAQ